MWALLQPVAVDETLWWVELLGLIIKAAAGVTALAVLLKVKPIRKVLAACAHWLWNNPAVAMTQTGFREMIRNEITPLRVEVHDLTADVSGLRRESVAQHEAVTDQLGDLQATVDGHGRRLERVETALMNGWRRGER